MDQERRLRRSSIGGSRRRRRRASAHRPRREEEDEEQAHTVHVHPPCHSHSVHRPGATLLGYALPFTSTCAFVYTYVCVLCTVVVFFGLYVLEYSWRVSYTTTSRSCEYASKALRTATICCIPW